jgi:hypothetical protein
MNCPNCGAENDADARFCAECGAPLDHSEAEAPVTGSSFDMPADSDATIMSTREELAAQERTLRVDQAQLAAAMEDNAYSPSEPVVPPPPVDIPPRQGNNGGPDNRNRTIWIIVGVIIVLMLCCCCASIIAGGIFAEDIERMLGMLNWLTVYV